MGVKMFDEQKRRGEFELKQQEVDSSESEYKFKFERGGPSSASMIQALLFLLALIGGSGAAVYFLIDSVSEDRIDKGKVSDGVAITDEGFRSFA